MRNPKRCLVTVGAPIALVAAFLGTAIEEAPLLGAAVPAATTLRIGPNVVAGTITLPSAGAAAVGHINGAAGTHLSIVPTFESSVTASPEASQIESAFNDAIGQFEAEYSNPITVDVNVAFTGSGLGMNSDDLFCTPSPSYSTYRTALLSHETTPDQITSEEDLPSADPTGGGEMCAPLPEEMALGILPANCFSTPTCSAYVPTITIGSSYSYTFNPSNRAVSGEFDFIGVVEHEMSEVLGRMPGLNINLPSTCRMTCSAIRRPVCEASPSTKPALTSRSTTGPRRSWISTRSARMMLQDYISATPDSFDAFAAPAVSIRSPRPV